MNIDHSNDDPCEICRLCGGAGCDFCAGAGEVPFGTFGAEGESEEEAR